MTNGSDGSPRPPEKRAHGRHRVSRPVEFSPRGKTHFGQLENISTGGVFIQARGEFPAGEEVTLFLPSPGSEVQKRKARIVQSDAKGFSARFTHPGYTR